MENETSAQKMILWFGAIFTFLVGVGIGLAALVASLGVWVGLWDFRTGFSILGAVNPYTGGIALLCLLEAAALLIMAKKWNSVNGTKLFSFAITGALAAAIAWYIPTTFQAPEGQSYPPIHDATSDTVNPPTYVAVLPLRVDAPNSIEYGDSPNMTAERLAMLQIEAFPNLVPQILDDSADEVFSRALAAVETMGWELVEAAPADGRIEATATTFWFRFKDDIVIRIQPEGNQTRLDARSVSRVGGGDAGANANRLLAFFEIL